MKNLFVRLKLIRAFIGLVKDPNRTEMVFEISEVLLQSNPERVKKILKPILEDPEFQSLEKSGFNPRLNIEELRKLPHSTFGRSVAEFLDSHHFEPNGFPTVPQNGPIGYLVGRARNSHDLWHVIAGYETTVADELALQGFAYAQLGSAVSALIIAGGILHYLFFHPTELAQVFDRIVEGYQRGKKCRKLILERIEEKFPLNLEQVRQEYGLTA